MDGKNHFAADEIMIIHDKNTYFQILEQFEVVPHTQSRGWYEMHSLYKPERIIFIINNLENPTIACFAHIKKMFGLKMILIEGEAYKYAESFNLKNIRAFYKKISKLDFPIIEVNSTSEYSFDYEIAVRHAGFLRPVGVFSMPVTKIVNLQEEIGFNQNWKRNLSKANSYKLTFEAVGEANIEDCEDFLAIYAEMTNRKNLQFTFSEKQLFKLLSDENHFQLFFARNKEQKRIATVLIHRNREKSGLLYAATGKLALDNSASFFLYKELFKYLADDGVRFFDMEKLVPSKDEVNHVFNFKNGVKGEHKQLNGEWALYKNKIYRPLMYFVKKHLMKKREL